MTANELRIAKQIFELLPTITVAIMAAIAYVKWKNASAAHEERLVKMEKCIETNASNVIQIAKIHLDRHPDDAGKFIKKEFLNNE